MGDVTPFSDWITDQQAAEETGLSIWTIRNLRYEGEIEAFKHGRKVRIYRPSLI
jgi:excisionase family DNA binding protein